MHNYRMRPSDAVLWLLVWIVLDVVAFAALPGRQTWWVEFLVIVVGGLVSLVLVATLSRRFGHG